MATNASIDLVFNAKDNTKNAFQGVSAGLNQVKVAADKAAGGFASLKQSVQSITDETAGKLKQSFLVVQPVLERFFNIGIAGASALSAGLIAAGTGAVGFGVGFKKYVLDPLFQARSFLDGKNFLDVYTEQIVAASRASVGFAKALKTIGDSVADVIAGVKRGDLKDIFPEKPFAVETARLTEPQRQERLSNVQASNEALGLPRPETIEEGVRQIQELERATRRQQRAAQELRLEQVTETTRRFGLPDPRSVEAGIAALDRYEQRLRLQVAATAQGATASDKLRFQVSLLAQSIETAGRAIFDGFLPGLGSTLDLLKKVDTKVFETANNIGSISIGIGGALKTAAGYDEAIAAFSAVQQGVGAFTQVIGNVSQQIFFFQSAIQSVGQIAATGPFKLLIGQQVELRQQLLETQSTLVATNKIVNAAGEQLNRPVELGGDPGQAIIALSGATEAAIDQLRKDSLQLVGVTSRELSEVFNITTTNLASIGIETKNLLGDSADLTIKFAAALGTIGLPLFQARQEIGSILQGTVDNNSVLAKTLGISNEQIKKYKEQGTLIDKLNEKLKPFQAGNAIAAKSLSGVTSNIQEVFEVVALQAGKPLLDPLLEGLGEFYQFLADNQGAFGRFLEPIIEQLLRIQTAVFDAAGAIGSSIGPALANIGSGLIRSAANFITQFSEAVSGTLQILTPFISVLESLIGIFGSVNNGFGAVILKLIVFGKSIQTLSSAFDLFLNLVTGIGEVRFVLQAFTGGAVAQFVRLKESFTLTGSAVVALGLNFDSLVKTFPAVNKGLVEALGSFGLLAPVISSLIPKLSAFFVALTGLPAALRKIGSNLLGSIPKIDVFFAKFQLLGRVVSLVATKIIAALVSIKASLSVLGFGDLSANLDGVIASLQKIEAGNFKEGFGDVAGLFDNLGDATEKGLKKVDKGIGDVAKGKLGGLTSQVAASAVSFGLWAIAIAGAGIALSEFLQRRKDGGAEIRALTVDFEKQANALRGIDSSGLDGFNKSLKDNSVLAKDWVDKIILFERNFDKTDLKFDTLGDTVTSVLGSVADFAIRSFAFIISTARIAGLEIDKISRLAAGLPELIPGEQTDAEILKKQRIQELESQGIEVPDFKSLSTEAGVFRDRVDTRFAQEAKGIGVFDKDELLQKIRGEEQKKLKAEIEEENKRILEERKNLGIEDPLMESLLGAGGIEEQIAAEYQKIEDLVNGKGVEIPTKVEETAQDITKAALDPAFLANAKEFGKAIREELVPGDAEFKQIGEQISRTFSAIGQQGSSAGSRLAAVAKSIELVKQAGETGIIDAATVEDSIRLIEEFKNESLTAGGALKDSSEKGKEAFDAQITSLRQGLSIALQQGRNINLGVKSDDAQKQISLIDDKIKQLEEFQSAQETPDPITEKAIGNLRRAKAELEGVAEAISTLRQDTQPLPDPVQLYANAIAQGEKDLKKAQAKLTLEQQEETAATIAEFLEKRGEGELVFTRNLERDKAAINKQAIEEELAKTKEVIAKIEAERAKLTEFELERATESDEQLVQMKTRFAQKQIELFEAEIAEQQRVREEAERNIQDLLTQTENAIKETTLGIKEQEIAYDGILKKLEQQNRILEEGKRLVAAQTESAISGLDFLAANARGEIRQKNLAEATAAIRLQSVREQVKFDEISFNLEEQKTQLALEREAIAANIAQLEAEAGLARAQAEQEKVAIRPESTAAEKRAAELEVRSQAFQLKAAQQASVLTQEQLAQSQTLSALRRQSFEQEKENKLFAARRASAEAIASPTARRRAIRGLEEEQRTAVAQRIGLDPASFSDATTFNREIRGANRRFREGEFGVAPGPQALDILESFVPGLSDLTGTARDQATQRAIRLATQAGAFIDPSAVSATSPALGQDFRLQTAQSSVLQQLLTPVQSTLGLAAEGIGKAAQGFDTLIGELRAIAAKPTYNVTVTAGGQSLSTTGTAASQGVDLQKVLATAKRLVSNGLF